MRRLTIKLQSETMAVLLLLLLLLLPAVVVGQLAGPLPSATACDWLRLLSATSWELIVTPNRTLLPGTRHRAPPLATSGDK